MLVRLKTLMAGPDGVYPSGSVIDSEHADALVAGGYAEWVALPAMKPVTEIEVAATVTIEETPETRKPMDRGQRRRGSR